MATNQLLNALRAGDNRAIKELYISAYPACAKLILNNTGTKNDARDLFQEAMIVFFRKIREPQFELTCHVNTFIYSVVRNLWLKELRQRGKTGLDLSIDEPKQKLPKIEESDLEAKYEIEEKHKHIAKILKNFKEDCRRLLTSFYFKKMSLKEIADDMDYSNSFVKVKKKRCMDSLKKKVLESYQTSQNS